MLKLLLSLKFLDKIFLYQTKKVNYHYGFIILKNTKKMTTEEQLTSFI